MLPDAATGVLALAQERLGLAIDESYYEKLHRWSDALKAYEAKQLEDPINSDLALGRMRCLSALGETEKLFRIAKVRTRWGCFGGGNPSPHSGNLAQRKGEPWKGWARHARSQHSAMTRRTPCRDGVDEKY